MYYFSRQLPGALTLGATDFQNTQGIIFVVDSNDRDRISEAREERGCHDLLNT
jgi:hypothetical protein